MPKMRTSQRRSAGPGAVTNGPVGAGKAAGAADLRPLSVFHNRPFDRRFSVFQSLVRRSMTDFRHEMRQHEEYTLKRVSAGPIDEQAGSGPAQRIEIDARAGTSMSGDARLPQSTGAPLLGDARRYFESRLGINLGRVRIHSGPAAASAAQAIGARAYTVGNKIYFGRNQYRPSTDSGKRLLAHELAHVVQQTAATGQSRPGSLAAHMSNTAPRGVAQANRCKRYPTPKPKIATAAEARYTNDLIRVGYSRNLPFVITSATGHRSFVKKADLLASRKVPCSGRIKAKACWVGKAASWMIPQMIGKYKKYKRAQKLSMRRGLNIGLKSDLSNFPANNGISWWGTIDKCNIFVTDSLADAGYNFLGGKGDFYGPGHIYHSQAGLKRINTPHKCVRKGDVFASTGHTGIVTSKPNKSWNVNILEYQGSNGIGRSSVSTLNFRFFRVK
jgi:Domain of unknown function (DUF4157)